MLSEMCWFDEDNHVHQAGQNHTKDIKAWWPVGSKEDHTAAQYIKGSSLRLTLDENQP